MLHLVFAFQVAALILGAALIPLFVGKLRRAPSENEAAAIRAFLVSVLLMLARTLLYSVVDYSTNTSLSLFPSGFEAGIVSGFFYVFLVSGSAWALLAGFARSLGKRIPAWIALLFWAYISLVLGLFLLLMADPNLATSLSPLLGLLNIGVQPFIIAKLLAIAGCLALLPSALKTSRRADAVRLTGFALLAVIGQAADAWFRLDEASYLLCLPLAYGGYFGSLYVHVLLGNPRPAEAKRRILGPGVEESLAKEAGLDADERRMLALVLAGKSNKEIAGELGLGLSTEKHRLQKLFAQLGVATRNELLARVSDAVAGGE